MKSRRQPARAAHRIRCSELWGGIRNIDNEVSTAGASVSVYARAISGPRGGDVYYLGVCDNDLRTQVAVADVMGHGETVSQISCWLYEALSERINQAGGDRVLAELNLRANAHGIGAMSTALVMTYDRGKRRLSYASAGHPPALIRRRGSTGWEHADVASRRARANLPLGALEHTPYDLFAVERSRGDQIVLYSDGLIEASDNRGRMFGTERLLRALESVTGDPSRVKRRVLRAVADHTAGALPADDLTLMVIELG